MPIWATAGREIRASRDRARIFIALDYRTSDYAQTWFPGRADKELRQKSCIFGRFTVPPQRVRNLPKTPFCRHFVMQAGPTARDCFRIADHTSAIGFGVFLAARIPRVTPQT
jgi:hypothetical protein